MDPELKIRMDCKAQINLAMQQNYIPLIRCIYITNQGEQAVGNIHIKVSFSPEFAKEFEADIAAIEPGETIEISPVRIIISPDMLSDLTERMSGTISITVTGNGKIIATDTADITLLAADQWIGMNIMPELTAAYITPNHPAVLQTVNKAAHYLMKWTGSPSFTGYQTQDPNAVKLQMAAIYAALQEENIAYTMPPASYELTGQRVRLPYTVIEQKCGTCLDLSLLFASCAEAVGLYPVLIFIKGHAFSGCWLEDETFSDCVIDDIAAVSKRMADGINSICLVECTDFVAGKNYDFDRAVKHANDALLIPENFAIALDIQRCRGNGIRPLPVQADGKYSFAGFGERSESSITSTPSLIDLENLRVADTQANKNVTKQDIWERKLLDLSLRNSLINFRPRTLSIQLVAADLCRFEDELARGETFKIMPAPTELSLALSDAKIYEIENEKDLVMTIAEAEFKNRRIRTFLKGSDLDTALKGLHRKARLSLEENGANTLYLALGFLRWYETDKSIKSRYAPLVLVPVDIIRKISDNAYSIRIRSEDTQMNITLLEMLRQDFGINIGGLDPLPTDESGVDLQLVFNTIRRAIISHDRWDVEEIAFLGQFSFGRFIMWNDIRNRSEELRNNKVVLSLINGKMEWQAKNTEISPSEIDDRISPAEMAVPTSVDSSQLAAIYAAGEGESFVLHGPPGTGKSQTITNMIANALYHGKSVLFVAEKMAALSVVQNRLKNLGLDPFCLELHSNKAQKRAVLDQLEQVLSLGHIKSPAEYEEQASRLKAERQELKQIMTALHQPRPVGMSLYNAIVSYDDNKIYDGRITLENSFSETITSEKYQNAIELIRRISVAGKEIGGLASSPLKHYCRIDYSFDIRNEFSADAEMLLQLTDTFERSFDSFFAVTGINGNKSYGYIKNITELTRLILTGEYFVSAINEDTPVTEYTEDLDMLIKRLKELQELKGTLIAAFDQSILTADAESMRLSWKTNEQKWFIPKALGRRKLLRTLRAYAKDAGSVNADNYLEICDRAAAYQSTAKDITAISGKYLPYFGQLWQGEETDADRLTRYRNNTVNIRSIIKQLGDNTLTDKLSILTGHPGEAHKAVNDYDEAVKCINAIKEKYTVDTAHLEKAGDWFEVVKALAKGFAENADHLRERSVLEGLLAQIDAYALGDISAAYRRNDIDEDSIENAFVCAASKATIVSAMAQDTRLSSFQGAQFEVSLNRYREATENFRRLTVLELISRLSAKIPTSADGLRQGNSELSTLQKAIKSGGRMLSIRALFDSVPTLLRRICPCMLMSPISVAQYIDPKFPKFDVVIFDEASQMPTSEAVGAIARGDSVVIVGDPKQLPPTSFFSTQHTDEENYDKEDLESVLDDCLALSMPQKHLLWHYRSRHESLIAFSNARFYENKLLTFPSPDDRVRKVTRVQVDGFYDKSQTRQNVAEAKAVVDEIVRRLSDDDLRKYSIGVVTFSAVQQNLIDDMLSERFVKDPKLEDIADKMYEPIFIKNLENVQGDERDVILFSIGYGPDKNGRVSMNFGPINQDGGWRRLNVAVSRARYEMIVYSVLRPDQIDLSRTRAVGVAELKSFLEFAERGTQSLARNANDIKHKNDDLARIIAGRLKEKGYDAKCDIGCSGYKVDIGITHPENSDRFALGLILDSYTKYCNSSVDDMRITQPSVLKGLGWSIMNVHILDWLDNPDNVISKIEERLHQAIKDAKENNKADIPAAVKIDVSDLQTAQPDEENALLTPFTPCILPIQGTPDSFIEYENIGRVISAMRQVIAAEAPISCNALIKKVMSAWGISRKSKAVLSVIGKALSMIPHRLTEQDSIIWREDQTPDEYNIFRTGVGENKRRIEDVCLEEISAAIMYVLNAQISLPRNDLILAVARLFGYARVSAVEERVSSGIEFAGQRGLLTVNGDNISVVS